MLNLENVFGRRLFDHVVLVIKIQAISSDIVSFLLVSFVHLVPLVVIFDFAAINQSF